MAQSQQTYYLCIYASNDLFQIYCKFERWSYLCFEIGSCVYVKWSSCAHHKQRSHMQDDSTHDAAFIVEALSNFCAEIQVYGHTCTNHLLSLQPDVHFYPNKMYLWFCLLKRMFSAKRYSFQQRQRMPVDRAKWFSPQRCSRPLLFPLW